ncbi:zinc finger protein ZFPM2-like [Mercenaria mercenaria]|uniref:zinc finger protein ZFPM2-like n=1 Tax=Mercenaria mercenaria TaxID=6596 RepID=UPI00234E46B7|nr:zinc finger protein ZFPM2-like [Mercenaria mercenaria]
MSRRKQSNPKPFKRPEDEDDESDAASKLDQSDEMKEMEGNQSESSLHSDSENEPMEMENEEIKREVTSPVQVKEERTDDIENCYQVTENKPKYGEMSPRRQEVMKRLNFPADLLTLRQVDEAEFLQTGIPWSVISVTALPKGSTVGPYQGETVALSSIKPGELVLQFQGSDGEFSFIKVTEATGAWLSLLRPADHANTHNTQVVFEVEEIKESKVFLYPVIIYNSGGRIWCEIVEDLEQGTELLASFTTSEEESSASNREKSCADKSEAPVRETRTTPVVLKKPESKSVPHVTPQPALIYGCPFCGVRFSSRRTLEAHLTYYCSKKPPDFVSLQELHQQLQQQARALLEKQVQQPDEDLLGKTSPVMKADQVSPRGTKRQFDEKSGESSESNSSDSEESKQKSKSGELYRCPSCNYTTDRASSLQLHQRTHLADAARESERLSVSPLSQDETFCKECKIQFSSVSTYRGHKEFYCQYRLSGETKNDDNISEMASPGSRESSTELNLKMLKSQHLSLDGKSQILGAKGQLNPALLASNPILASPWFLQDFFLKNKQPEGITRSRHKSSSLMTSPASVEISSNHRAEDQPLDLSKSKSDKDDSNSANDFAVKSVKSEQGSPPAQLSPAAKKMKLNEEKTVDPAVQTSKTPLNIPSLHSSLLLGNQVQYVNKKPIPPLQSVSRCVECNIVFYKHENYLIHKEHYCSGRRGNKDSSSSDSDNGEQEMKDSEATDRSKSHASTETLSKMKSDVTAKSLGDRQQESTPRDEVCYRFYCIPCKIKFSSAGTLKAHKEFYCPHGKDSNENSSDKDSFDRDGERSSPNSSDLSTYQCENCKTDFCSARLLKLHICMCEMAPAPLLRCLYCDYVTQTENRLSEHMKVHVPTKAFKCNICGYRGNTARGMRMHGKMHVENGEEFTDDNMIEFEEPPLVPIQKNGVCEKGPVDMETELIRMKNEPYKRRRSRKSFEKSENMVPFLGQNMLTQICAACGQTFGNVSDFVIHLRMHEIAALEAMKNLKSLRCEHCSEYIADSLTSLLIHMQTKHPEQLPGTSKTEHNGQVENERSQSRDSQISNGRSRSSSVESSRTNKTYSSHEKSDSPQKPREWRNGADVTINGNNVKQDPESFDDDNVNGNSLDGNNENIPSGYRSKNKNDLTDIKKSRSSPPISQDLRSGDHSVSVKAGSPSSQRLSQTSPREPVRSPQLPSPPSLPVKSEPKSPPYDREQSKSLSPPKITTSPTSHEKLSPKLMSPDPKTRYLLSQNAFNIKREQTTPPRTETPKKSPPPLSPRTPIASPKLVVPLGSHSPKHTNIPLLYPQTLLSPYHFPPGIPLSFIPTPGLQTSPPIPSSASEKLGRKYCKHCDINFTYLSSFLTHKKYYCSARTSAEDSESPTATA